ncbi:MAG TPA: sigma-54 dependent transcriptional regulator [Spirochaetia bacterium]|nr:sigma-54 dependent transcriptional regulator [Spirochaetia bacterium]
MNLREPAILIVDDDELTAELYQAHLQDAGFERLILCADSRDVMKITGENPVSTVLLDLNMPHISGQELLDRIRAEYPDISIIVLTSEDRVETAVACMKKGAFDYIAKPVEPNRLINAVRLAATIRELRDEVSVLSTSSARLRDPDAFRRIITASRSMLQVLRYVEAVSTSPKAVLITGESGTGKELIAQAIHSVSGRKGEFVAVNVSGLDDTMFSDTLFGHIRGAYTGADSARRGLIDRAADGTLFLDEIGDLPTGAQVKLLRLLQENEFYPLGSDRPERARVRILAATNADLAAKQNEGTFRKDLYFRLMSHRVHLPPLRDRPEDIQPLVRAFLGEAAGSMGKRVPAAPPELHTLLSTYHFPGNVRELQAMIFDAVSRHEGGVLSLAHFNTYIENQRKLLGSRPFVSVVSESGSFPAAKIEPELSDQAGLPAAGDGLDRVFSYTGPFPSLAEVEDYFVAQALEKAHGNQSIAARMLGVSQSTLSRRQHKSRVGNEGHDAE